MRCDSLFYWWNVFTIYPLMWRVKPHYCREKNPITMMTPLGRIAAVIINSSAFNSLPDSFVKVACISLCTLKEAPPKHTCLYPLFIEVPSILLLSVVYSRFYYTVDTPTMFLSSEYFLKWRKVKWECYHKIAWLLFITFGVTIFQ